MNKKLDKAFTDYGLTVTGKTAYGTVKGYEMSVQVAMTDTVSPVKINIAFYASPEQRASIEAALNNRTDIKGVKQLNEFGLYLGLNGITVASLVKKLPDILDWTLGMLQLNGALGVGYCPHCGNAMDANDARRCNVAGFELTVHSGCVTAINNEIDSNNAAFKNAPNNYLRGFVGALIGGVVGGLLVALFYVLNFVSAISGIAAVGLGAFLYTKFGGKPSKIMVLIVTVTSLVCLVAAVYITNIVAAGIEATNQGLYHLSALEAFELCLTYEEYSNAFYTDLALVVVFAMLGMGFYVWWLWRSVKQAGNQSHVQTTSVPGDNGVATPQSQPQQPQPDVFDQTPPRENTDNKDAE